jgi:arsenate reductase
MAEGLFRAMRGDDYDVYSAGTEPGTVNPFAIIAMKEIGIDISGHYSKSTDEFTGMEIEYVITVCDSAKETCPVFSGGRNIIHKRFEDPSATEGTDEDMLNAFRRIRDEIKDWIGNTF